MSVSHPPCFYEPALRTRFTLDIRAASGNSCISETEQQRLLRLLDETPAASENNTRLRVDKLVMGDGSPTCAELSSAWLISDPASADAPVYLHTLLFGLERFKDRPALLATLQRRFATVLGVGRTLEYEQVEAPLFEQRMLTILEQQVGHLTTLTAQLQTLPTLHAALGQALLERIQARVADARVDVFSHLLQIVYIAAPASVGSNPNRVVMSMTLAEAALHEFINQPLSQGLARQFLDESGAVLTTSQAAPYVAALAEVRSALSGIYERMLGAFWVAAPADGQSERMRAAQSLAESFRHALLVCREERTLSLYEFRMLRSLLPFSEPDALAHPAIVGRISVAAPDKAAVKLAGIFLIEFPFGPMPGLYLYSSQNGLSRLLDRKALIAYFDTDAGRTQLLAHTSLEDHSLLSDGSLTLRLDEIEPSFFLGHIDSVIAVQMRNLRYVLGRNPLQHEQVAARIDDALDIRGLIDWRLLGLSDSGRWLQGGPRPESEWVTLPASQMPVSTVPAEPLDEGRSSSWMKNIQSLGQIINDLDSVRPDVVECAARVLDNYLAVLGEPMLKARTLWVQSESGSFIGLVELFLRRVSGYSTERIANNGQIYTGSAPPHGTAQANRLPAKILNHMLDHALAGFAQAYERQVSGFNRFPVRMTNCQIRPQVLSNWIREQALNLELSIEYRINQMSPSAIAMIAQVLERPIDSLRRVWGDAAVSVNTVQLIYAPAKAPVVMTNAFVLHRPRQPGSYVFWSGFTGFRAHDSLSKLEQFLKAELASRARRGQWLELFDEADRALLISFGTSALTLHLQAIEGHFIEKMRETEIAQQCETITATYQRAVNWKLKTELFANLLRAAERADKNRDALDTLGIGLQNILLGALTPPWLKNAPRADVKLFIRAARDLYVNFDPKKTFLFGIPELREYARQALSTRLKADFPELDVEPDAITTLLTIYTPAPVTIGSTPSGLAAATGRIGERLPDFAINRLGAAQQGLLSISVDREDDDEVIAAITPAYVEEMVRSLDVGGAYQRLLDEKLDEKGDDYATRQAFYIKQQPPLERLAALQARIKDDLSDQAYAFIEAVLYMPDGLARLPIHGKDIIFSPLQLLAEEGARPDLVTGAYIIAPRVPEPGPWVLYAVLNDELLFNEYDDQASLVTDIRTSPALQKFILQRLPAHARVLYDHGGFMEPHLPFSTESFSDVPVRTPGPVTLQVTPYLGNALQYLFRGTLDTLKLLVKEWSVTSSESDRQARLHLVNLVVGQGMVFLPGRIGVLVGLWQSESLLQASIDAATRQNWGEVAATFATALGTLVGSHPVSGEENIELLEVYEAPAPEGFSPLPEFGWSKGALTPQQVGLLREFSVTDVALETFDKDELLNVYRSKSGLQQYAAVAGVVYRVRQDDDGWRIVGDTADGPPIRLNDRQQWELNLPWGLKGGGGIVTRIKDTAVDLHVYSIAIVEARGMEAIRTKFCDRARRIVEAHSHARQYLENCLENLEAIAEGGIDTRTRRIVSDFFGVAEPDTRLYESIKTNVTKLLSALMHPSLSPFSSERFVIVTNRMGHEGSNAYVFADDPAKRIFLTEEFFALPHYRLKLGHVADQAFNHGAHFRATTLLHELSHLECETEDIAYLEANAPFIDLLEETTEYRLGIRDKLSTVQQRTLSHLTDEQELFKQVTDGRWADLKHADGKAMGDVLRITGTTTLEQARPVFYSNADKRSEVILRNADSLALLITLLGRQKFAA